MCKTVFINHYFLLCTVRLLINHYFFLNMYCASPFLYFPFLGTLPSGAQLLHRVHPKRRNVKAK
jgi:hypothetical protein